MPKSSTSSMCESQVSGPPAASYAWANAHTHAVGGQAGSDVRVVDDEVVVVEGDELVVPHGRVHREDERDECDRDEGQASL